MAEWDVFADLIDDWLDVFTEAGLNVEDDDGEGVYAFDAYDAKPEQVLPILRPHLPQGLEAEVVTPAQDAWHRHEIRVSRIATDAASPCS